ncbi:saframycin Mx1 synthetase B [Legionella steigerwaltii]|uniref:Saframycin Mx1 synthetase B n=1 Tax=Legionella steigerwaltii TaxID=460 RepID=A0A378LE80_9GAMM|nr:thioester reductase domain-containing protein [Legionella steigerwaltii]KTD78737.1 saframycin Mx1 synthetase B [Legionella steigerwaltii]STY24172.1 saframycin Mx1 synthetase B [Legionella steigerwaltii]
MGESYISLVDLLEKKVEQNLDFPIYTFIDKKIQENKSLTYGELAEQAKKIASVLYEVTHPGDRVLIIYPPGLDFIAAFFGCLYAGTIAVPSYAPTTKDWAEKFQQIIENSGARVVLTTKEIVLQLNKLNGKYKNYEAVRFITTEDWIHAVDTWRYPSLTGNHLAFLQYTSGSTGKPKGVMISHDNLLHNLFVIEKATQLTQEDVSVSWLPHFHDMGLIGGILQPVFSTIPVKLMSPLTFLQRPATWLETISHYRATATVAPNFAYDLCTSEISEEEKSLLDLSSLQFVMSGAEPIRKATVDRFIQRFASCGFSPEIFYPCYGLAESTLMVTGGSRKQGISSQCVDKKALNQGKVLYCDETHPDARSLIHCGQPIDNCFLAIVNPETLEECPEKVVGEIWVAGKSVGQGYWQLPEETKYYFNAHIASKEYSFLRTGDLGYLDQGALYVTGRLKDLIIMRGRNYYPHDLEDAIHTCHPHLRAHSCAIFSVEENDRELLVIVQEIKKKVQAPNLEEIISTLRNNLLQTHGIDADVVALVGRNSVPKTTSGKTQRLLCKKKYLEKTLDIICIDRIAADHTEKQVMDAANSEITQLLKPIFNSDITALDKEKKLSELGLNSVKLAQLHYVLSTHSDKDISIEFLLADPCLNEIMDLFYTEKAERQKRLDHAFVDLAAEFNQYKNIAPHITCSPQSMPQHILLTGATGFLGAYLLRELLTYTNWRITCLVQASSFTAGMGRVIKNMEHYGLWNSAFHERIKVVLGNLEKNNLGLFRQDWEYLADTVDLIVHGAALLNFIYPYQKLMASNVLGTKQLIKLAAYKRLKALHYISTVGYFMAADLADDVVISEQTELAPEDGIYGGYNQTKWLAERLVVHARSYNIPTVVYRPSLITGESQTGYWNHGDVVCRILKGCIELEARPNLDVGFNFVPVDYVAKAITHFAKEKPYHADTYHLINPQEVYVDQLFGYVQAKGFKVKKVTYPDWEKMIKQNSGYLNHSFSPLRPFFTEKIVHKGSSLFDLYLHNNKAKIDCTYTKTQLANHEIYCEKIDGALFNKYLDYLIHCGYLTQVTEEASNEE